MFEKILLLALQELSTLPRRDLAVVTKQQLATSAFLNLKTEFLNLLNIYLLPELETSYTSCSLNDLEKMLLRNLF